MGNFCCSAQNASEILSQIQKQRIEKDHNQVDSEDFNQLILRVQAKEAASTQLEKIYCNIGLICFQRIQNGRTALSFATGSIIQDRLVLTSAHSFIHREVVGQKVELCKPRYFYYKVHGDFSEEAKYEVDDYRVNQIYMDINLKRCGTDFLILNLNEKQQLISLDFAIIKLKKPVNHFKIPNILRDFNLGHKISSDVAVFGYPKEMYKIDYGDVVGAKISGDISSIKDIKGNYVIHNIETSNGQSGSPIVLFTQTNSGKVDQWYIGIHSGYYPSKICSDKRYYCGPLIMSTTVQRLFQWEQELLSKQERKGFNIWELINNTPVKISSYLQQKQPSHLQGKLEQSHNKPKNSLKYDKKAFKKLEELSKKEYKRLKIQFDTRTQQASFYSIIDKTRVKRTNNVPKNNLPFHFTTLCPIPQGKWSFSLRINNYCYSQIVLIGFMSQFRKFGQHQSSGMIEQKECVSLNLCKDTKQSLIRRKGALLIQGDVFVLQEELFLKEKQGILTLYVDMNEKNIYWDFGRGVVRTTPIPKNVYTPAMFFFVGLSHSSEQIQILY